MIPASGAYGAFFLWSLFPFSWVSVFLVDNKLPFPYYWYCMYVRYVCIFVPLCRTKQHWGVTLKEHSSRGTDKCFFRESQF